MKLQSNNLLENLTFPELQNLTAEVKETLDANFKKETKKVFSAAQLWAIQRSKRNSFSQRNYF